jgi:hypothetical protein
MAGEKSADGSFKVEGKQTVEFELLDDEAKQEVIKCIQTKGRIKVLLDDVGQIDLAGPRAGGFRQLID